jgi:hypothetical protein
MNKKGLTLTAPAPQKIKIKTYSASDAIDLMK